MNPHSRETNEVAESIPIAPFFILGPTAVGKSRVAVEFAEAVGGEIVGADAFQVYDGLDLLSAKPAADLRARVPHHLIGEVPLTASFDVAQWLSRARECIAKITLGSRVPVVSGGTGLYVRALTHGLAPLPTADLALRSSLENIRLAELAKRLLALDPQTSVDLKNPRRVVRALEVCILTGRPFSSFRLEWPTSSAHRGVILTRPREELHAAIIARTKAMFAEGVADEVSRTDAIGVTASRMIGISDIRAMLAGKMSMAACMDAVSLATRQYAKRQLTWFRRERAFPWMNLSEEKNPTAKMRGILEQQA